MYQANNAPKSMEASDETDIFSMTFEGAVPFQEGEFIVSANNLNGNGEIMGGGLVANFNDRAAAEQCYDFLMQKDRRHRPVLERMDWDTYESELLRSSSGETIEEIRAKAEDAFNAGRVIRRRKNKS